MKLLRWDGCFTVTLAPWESIKHLYLFRIAFKQLCDCKKEHSWVQQKIIYKFLSGFPFRVFLCSSAKHVGKMHWLCNRMLFCPSSFLFATWNLIISLQHIKLCISLHSQSLWTLCIKKCHEKSSINGESYFAELVNKNLNS